MLLLFFDGASLEQITDYTNKAGVPAFGHTYLYDGGTGERFDQKATVGVIYMIKLGHMIDDKNARTFYRSILTYYSAAIRR